MFCTDAQPELSRLHARTCSYKMQIALERREEMEIEFNQYLADTFPEGSKRTRSALIRSNLADRIVKQLKTSADQDKNFRHFVKKSKFNLLDLPEAGLRDVLVAEVKETKQAR